MFAIRFCYDVAGHRYDYKIFETVGQARKWYLEHVENSNSIFYDMLFVLPAGLKNPLQWCYDNIK